MKFKYINNKKGLIRKLIGFSNVSYSHRGEDIVIYNLLTYSLNIKEINYLDIGCSDPVHYSNTYYFYRKGHRGVCVDPRKILKTKFRKKRKLDSFLNLAISNENGTRNFFEFDLELISTLDIKEKEMYEEMGYKLKKTYPVNTKSINSIMNEHFNNKELHLLDLDTEGHDFSIIKSIDFEIFKPYVICVEVVNPKTGEHLDDVREIIEFLKEKNYVIYADTKANLIFLNKDKYNKSVLKPEYIIS